MRAANAASLDPGDFRHEIVERPGLQISQVDHPFQVRSIGELHIPCACGRPLCGLETEWIHDPQGDALYYLGVCLVCGRQEGIYISEPRGAVDVTKLRKDAQLAAEVKAIVEQVVLLRENESAMTEAAAQTRPGEAA